MSIEPLGVCFLHPIYEEFWRSEEKRLFREVQNCEAGSVRQMIANIFYLKAQWQVKLLDERKAAISFHPWAFYVSRANSIAKQFDTRIR